MVRRAPLMAAMFERSKSSVVVATYQPLFSPPNMFSLRHPHVFEEDLVEVAAVGDVRDALDGHAWRLHVHDEGADALVLGHVRVRAREQDHRSATWPFEVQIFWPLTT